MHRIGLPTKCKILLPFLDRPIPKLFSKPQIMPEGKALAVLKSGAYTEYVSILRRLITPPSGIRWDFENNFRGRRRGSHRPPSGKKSGFGRHRKAAAADLFHILNANIIGNDRHLCFILHDGGHTFGEISFIFNIR